MHRSFLFLMVTAAALFAWKPAGAQDYKELMIPFYSESLRITYSPSFLSPGKPAINDRALSQHFHALSKTDFAPLLRSLNQSKKLFQLNDWLYFRLMQGTRPTVRRQEQRGDRARLLVPAFPGRL